MATKTARKPKHVKVEEIDADTWAESGGTAGMFGKLWKQGRLKIVPTPDDYSQIIPESFR